MVIGDVNSEIGNPESVWETWLTDCRPFDFAAYDRLIVVAAHPDDETLGLGGCASKFAERGLPVTVISASDGDASHPGSPTLTPSELAVVRRTESMAALKELGIAEAIGLGFADGDLTSVEHAVESYLDGFLNGMGATTLCAAPFRADGHPDHEAVGRAAARACALHGIRFVEYPIWWWHWATPATAPPAAIVNLSSSTIAAKRRAIEHYRSQILPLSPDPADRVVLPDYVLTRFLRPTELIFV